MKKPTRKENKMQFKSKLNGLLLKRQADLGREIAVSEIAEATGLSKQTIYDWKKGIQVDCLDADTADAFLKYLEVDMSQLVELVPHGGRKSRRKK